jgi:hypothetical protein
VAKPGHGSVPLREHLEALRAADDRRYAEVALEREKAQRIKEKADEIALRLARDAQLYRDEQANNLRNQIEAERGNYATKADVQALSDKFDAAQKPVIEFMAAQLARTGTIAESRSETRLNANLLIAVIGLLISAAIVFAAFHH